MENRKLTILRTIIDDVLSLAQELYEIAETYCDAGVARSWEEYNEFVRNKGRFPSCYQIFKDIDLIKFSDEEAERYDIWQIKSLLEELLDRITALKVFYSELIEFVMSSSDEKTIKFGLLTGLSYSMNSLMYKRQALERLADEKLGKDECFAESDDADDSDDENESVNLEDSEDFQEIYSYLQDVFRLLENQANAERREKIERYHEYVMQSLDEFAKTGELKPFSFSIVYVWAESSSYIDFSADEDTLTISDGGHVYDPYVGGDSFTNWVFTLYSDGDTDGECYLNLDEMAEKIEMGARIEISDPEEFVDDEEDEEEDDEVYGEDKRAGDQLSIFDI